MRSIIRLIAPAALGMLGLANAVTAQDAPPQASAPPPAQPVITYRAEGTWSGASKCTELAVRCVDHQIVIRVAKAPNPSFYDVDFTTVVGGAETPENHLIMAFSDDHHVLSAHFIDELKRPAVYFLAVKGDKIHGVMMVNGRTIERSLDLVRTSDVATPLPWAAAAGSSSSSSTQSSASQ